MSNTMDEPEGYSVIDVDRVILKAKSGLAFLMEVEGDEVWVPVSVIHEDAAVYRGQCDAEIEIATWFAKKQGWATS